jgi:tetratricopeptide (TPR) repeat protein
MTDYRIRRDRSALGSGALFSGRRRSAWLSPLLFINALVLILAGLAWWQFPEAQKLALGVIGSAPTPTPHAVEYAQRGDRAFWRGDLDASVANYREAARQRPDDVGILYEYARMLIYRSYDDPRNAPDRDEALRIAQQAVDADPTNARAYTILCWAQTEIQSFEEAARNCLRAIDGNANDAEAHAFLSRAYEGSLRFEEAGESALRGVTANPQSIEANTVYGNLLMTFRRYDLAKNYFEQAIKIHPRLSQSYFYLGGLNRVMASNFGQPELLEAAISNYNAVLSMNRRSIKAYVRLCQTYMQSGQFNLARDNCKTATSLDPDSTEAWRFLGEVMYRTRVYDEAVTAFAACTSREASLPPAQRQWQCWAYQGLAHERMQRCPRAFPLFYELLVWTTSAKAIELANTGLDLCGGTVPTTPLPSPPPVPTFTPDPDATQG